jgi:hypothetical protein
MEKFAAILDMNWKKGYSEAAFAIAIAMSSVGFRYIACSPNLSFSVIWCEMVDWQMEELILVVGESSTDVGIEFWYTEDGVQNQLKRLENYEGTWALQLYMQNRKHLFENFFDRVSRTSF